MYTGTSRADLKVSRTIPVLIDKGIIWVWVSAIICALSFIKLTGIQYRPVTFESLICSDI